MSIETRTAGLAQCTRNDPSTEYKNEKCVRLIIPTISTLHVTIVHVTVVPWSVSYSVAPWNILRSLGDHIVTSWERVMKVTTDALGQFSLQRNWNKSLKNILQYLAVNSSATVVPQILRSFIPTPQCLHHQKKNRKHSQQVHNMLLTYPRCSPITSLFWHANNVPLL